MTYLRPVSMLEPGDHACLVYDDDRRRDELLLSFMEAGLDQGDRVLYLANGADAGIVTALSRRARPGQLTVLPEAAYLERGAFDPDAVLDGLRAAVDDSCAGGFRALRAAGGPPAALTCNGHSQLLVGYERRANELMEDERMVAVCAYDVRKTHADALLGVVDAHPIVFYALRPDPRLHIDADPPERLTLRGRLEHATLAGLVGPLSAAIATDGDVAVDLAEIEFIDVAGLRLLVEAADLLEQRGATLTLVESPGWLPSILSMLGYDDRRLVLQ